MTESPTSDTAERRAWMGLLARAEAGALERLSAGLGALPEAHMLRPPEIGGVMVRGRTGGTGAPFNLGEMTVTRCALRLDCGTVGHGWVQGRDRGKARLAALLDAMLQTGRASEVRDMVIAPLERAESDRRSRRAAKAAATRVEFFTLARG